MLAFTNYTASEWDWVVLVMLEGACAVFLLLTFFWLPLSDWLTRRRMHSAQSIGSSCARCISASTRPPARSGTVGIEYLVFTAHSCLVRKIYAILCRFVRRCTYFIMTPGQTGQNARDGATPTEPAVGSA
jgi:hypothetical protein